MPLKIVSRDELLVGRRGRRPIVQQLSEYIEAKTKIANGLKPEEAIQITFPVSDKPGMKTILQTFKRTLKADMKRLHITDYEVSAFRDGETNVITIVNAPPITGLKSVPHKKAASR